MDYFFDTNVIPVIERRISDYIDYGIYPNTSILVGMLDDIKNRIEAEGIPNVKVYFNTDLKCWGAIISIYLDDGFKWNYSCDYLTIEELCTNFTLNDREVSDQERFIRHVVHDFIEAYWY